MSVITEYDLLKERLVVFVQPDENKPPQRVWEPIEVNLAEGTVRMRVLFLPDGKYNEDSSPFFRAVTDPNPLPPVADLTQEKTVAGKIYLIDRSGKIVKESDD